MSSTVHRCFAGFLLAVTLTACAGPPSQPGATPAGPTRITTQGPGTAPAADPASASPTGEPSTPAAGTAAPGSDSPGSDSSGSHRGRDGQAAATAPAPYAAAAGQVDVIEVGKCFTNATRTSGGQMLIQARSSDPAALLRAYRPDGTLIGAVQNGFGDQRYGGTVIAWQPTDPVTVTIRSSSGGSVSVPTTPYEPVH